MSAESISGSQLDSVVKTAKQTAAVFFWAAWEGACRAYMPTYEQLAKERGDRIGFYKFDVDGDQPTTTKYGVKSVPTVQLFKGGQLVNPIVGAPTREKLNTLIADV